MVRINKFHADALKILGEGLFNSFAKQRPPIPVYRTRDDEGVYVRADDDRSEQINIPEGRESDATAVAYAFRTDTEVPAERVLLKLPSALPVAKLRTMLPPTWVTGSDDVRPDTAPGLQTLIQMEAELRIGQLNDALQDIRVQISHQAMHYREGRSHNTKGPKTRSQTTIQNMARSVAHHRRIYNLCRERLTSLRMPAEFFARYQVITNADIRVSGALNNPNVPGMTRSQLSWIFQIELSADPGTRDDVVLLECECLPNIIGRVIQFSSDFRVHWLFARAMKLRWGEELHLVRHELVWTWMFYVNRAKEWNRWAVLASGHPNHAGHTAYARKQGALWEKMAVRAHANFAALCPSFITMATRLASAMG